MWKIIVFSLLLSGCQAVDSLKGWVEKARDVMPSKPDEPILATVGNEYVTLSEFRRQYNALPPDAPARLNPEGRKQFLNSLVRRKTIVVLAKQAGLEKDPGYLTEMQDKRQRVLADLQQKQVMARLPPISESELREFHKTRPQIYGPTVEYSASQIVVHTPAEVKKVQVLLKTKPFADVARSVSAEPVSAAQGGKMAPFRPGTKAVDLATEKVIGKLVQGRVSAPFKTSRGFIFLRKDGERLIPVQPFEQVRDDVQKKVERDRFEQWFRGARSAVSVQINESLVSSLN